MNKFHLCRYYTLYDTITLNEIIKKNCERCLLKIINSELRILFKKDRQKEDFLFRCVKFNNVYFLRIILKSEYSKIFQLSINNKNKEGKNVLYVAIQNFKKYDIRYTDDDDTECLDLLLKCNNINVIDPEHYYLHAIINTLIDPRLILKYLKLLIDKGCDPKKLDTNNNSLLHTFFKRERKYFNNYLYTLSDDYLIYEIHLLNFLLSLGMDINAKNLNNETPLKLCICSSGNEEFLKILLSFDDLLINEYDVGGSDNSFLYGISNISSHNINYTPIHHIVSRDEYNYLKILLNTLSDKSRNYDVLSIINTKSTKILHTPLHIACYSEKPNSLNIVKLLIEYGASLNEKCSAGLLPIDYARLNCLGDIHEYLSNYQIFLNDILNDDECLFESSKIQLDEDDFFFKDENLEYSNYFFEDYWDI